MNYRRNRDARGHITVEVIDISKQGGIHRKRSKKLEITKSQVLHRKLQRRV